MSIKGKPLMPEHRLKIIAGMRNSENKIGRPKSLPLKVKFQEQKDRSIQRGIAWNLTFGQWLKIWIDSGHLNERGCKSHQYCMARKGDEGSYAVGNVTIVTVRENHKEAKISDAGRAAISKLHKGNRYTVGKTWRHSAQAIENMSVAAFKREAKKRIQRAGVR